MFRASGVLTPANVADPQQLVRSEVKNLFLIDDSTGQSYDSCLAVTGKELIQASLVNLQHELWRYNFADTISEVYSRLVQNRNYQTEV